MGNLVIIARIEAKAECRALVHEEAIKLIAPTRNEEGCLCYNLHQDNENENLFIFHEIWENAEVLVKHSQTAHFKAFQEVSKDALVDFTVNKMTQI